MVRVTLKIYFYDICFKIIQGEEKMRTSIEETRLAMHE